MGSEPTRRAWDLIASNLPARHRPPRGVARVIDSHPDLGHTPPGLVARSLGGAGNGPQTAGRATLGATHVHGPDIHPPPRWATPGGLSGPGSSASTVSSLPRRPAGSWATRTRMCLPSGLLRTAIHASSSSARARSATGAVVVPQCCYLAAVLCGMICHSRTRSRSGPAVALDPARLGRFVLTGPAYVNHVLGMARLHLTGPGPCLDQLALRGGEGSPLIPGTPGSIPTCSWPLCAGGASPRARSKRACCGAVHHRTTEETGLFHGLPSVRALGNPQRTRG